MKTFRHILIALSVVSLVLPSFAQPGRMEDHPAHERIERLKKIRMVEMLDLKEEQSVRIFSRMKELEQKRRELMKEKGETLDKIERLLRNNADEKEYEKLFQDMKNVEMILSDEHRKFLDGLGDILTITQRGKYFLFERQFEREIRDAMRDVQKRRYRMRQQEP